MPTSPTKRVTLFPDLVQRIAGQKCNPSNGTDVKAPQMSPAGRGEDVAGTDVKVKAPAPAPAPEMSPVSRGEDAAGKDDNVKGLRRRLAVRRGRGGVSEKGDDAASAWAAMMIAGAAALLLPLGAKLHTANYRYVWLVWIYTWLVSSTIGLVASALATSSATRIMLWRRSTASLAVLALFMTLCTYHPYADLADVGDELATVFDTPIDLLFPADPARLEALPGLVRCSLPYLSPEAEDPGNFTCSGFSLPGYSDRHLGFHNDYVPGLIARYKGVWDMGLGERWFGYAFKLKGHALFNGAALGLAHLQMQPGMRKQYPTLHRWTGWGCALCTVLGVSCGLWVGTAHLYDGDPAYAGWWGMSGLIQIAGCIWGSLFFGIKAAMRRNYRQHEVWMWRYYGAMWGTFLYFRLILVVGAALFARMGCPVGTTWVFACHTCCPVGMAFTEWARTRKVYDPVKPTKKVHAQ